MLDLKRLLGWSPDIELDEDEYRRPPRVLRGDLDFEQQSGVGEVYLSAPRPNWTTKAPSHEGTWWVRVPGYQRKVVEVYRRDRVLWMRWGDIPAAPVPQRGLEWSDRALPEPVEPRDAA